MSDADAAGNNQTAPGSHEAGRAVEIEMRIAELKARWPAHSVPPQMWDELEGLEDELERLKNREAEG